MYYVYRLLDYKGFPFYIGITKNLPVRIREHMQCKGNNPAKNYRVRRCIKAHNTLHYSYNICETLERARQIEKEDIEKFKSQLVNVQYGKQLRRKGKTRKSGRSAQCPTCGNWYKRIKAHRCKNE